MEKVTVLALGPLVVSIGRLTQGKRYELPRVEAEACLAAGMVSLTEDTPASGIVERAVLDAQAEVRNASTHAHPHHKRKTRKD